MISVDHALLLWILGTATGFCIGFRVGANAIARAVKHEYLKRRLEDLR